MNEVILLADPKNPAWGFANYIKNHILKEKSFDVPLEEVSIDHFRNKEIDMHVSKNVRGKNVYFIHDSTKNPQEWWIELLLLKDLLLSASAENISFVLPNMLYSRKDRKEKPHVPISARALANTISPNLKRIITMDLHAPQIQGFYPENIPLDNLYSFPEVVRYLELNPVPNLENLVIVSPDAGGVDRATSFAKRMKINHPISFIYKQRDRPGEIKDMTLVGNVKGLDVLIVDDIIDSGNTQFKAAELLRESGAQKLYCYGTHGIFTKGTDELLNIFDRVITSNTHYRNNGDLGGVEVIDMSPLFAEAIYRAQKGISISSLFKK